MVRGYLTNERIGVVLIECLVSPRCEWGSSFKWIVDCCLETWYFITKMDIGMRILVWFRWPFYNYLQYKNEYTSLFGKGFIYVSFVVSGVSSRRGSWRTPLPFRRPREKNSIQLSTSRLHVAQIQFRPILLINFWFCHIVIAHEGHIVTWYLLLASYIGITNKVKTDDETILQTWWQSILCYVLRVFKSILGVG